MYGENFNMSTGVSYNSSISISVDKAKQLYNVTDADMKLLNADGDDKITLSELKKFGLNKYKGLAEFFNSKTNGALAVSESKLYAQNPNSIKSNFMKNHNAGQLSPGIYSDFDGSTVGNTLPLMYG